LANELEDARRTFEARQAEHTAALQAENIRAAAAHNDAAALAERAARADALARKLTAAHADVEQERARAEEEGARAEALRAELERAVRAVQAEQQAVTLARRAGGDAVAGLEAELALVKQDLAEIRAQARSDEMLRAAELDRVSAMLSSAERERDALLGDMQAQQARANAEAARRAAGDEELTKLRLQHNQSQAEAARLRAEMDAGRRSPEVEAEQTALRQRIEALERDNGKKEAELADKLVRIKQMNEKIDQLTERLGRVETSRFR
jgi:chromosome segregation ATPase